MRWIVILGTAALLAACGLKPQDLGITGPGTATVQPPPSPADATMQTPGVPGAGQTSSPTGQRYFGYN